MALFDPTAALAMAGDVAGALGPRKMVAVEGPPGSGRNTLLERLAAELGPSAVIVRVPAAEDADAPIHALLQAAQSLGRDAVSKASGHGHRASLEDRAREVFGELVQTGRRLVVYMPDRAPGRPVEDDEPTQRWLERFVSAVRDEERLPFALIVPVGTLRRLDDGRTFTRFQLPEPEARLHFLDAAAQWGVYAEHAARTGAELRKTGRSFSPIQVRLMVGLVALGVPAAQVAQAAPGPEQSSLHSLIRKYVALLVGDERSALRETVRRFLLPRVPLPASDALRLAGAGPIEEPLLRYCLAYDDATLRVPHYLRSELLRRLPPSSNEDETQKEIADHHKALDSARSAAEAAAKSASDLNHWLEKVHHLAHSGAVGAAEWSDQTLESREFLIDRARSLSIRHRAYVEAAELYAKCLGRWNEDAYALHYRGYNLDRAGKDSLEVERCYRAALADDGKANLYYNSRLVTFLIEQGRPIDAEKAWGATLAHLAARDPDLVAQHVTQHVVAAWLAAGEVQRARAAFDSMVDPEARYPQLAQELADAEEAAMLGVSVYPPRAPMNLRWRAPRLAQSTWSGAPRVAWYPGRVLSFEDEMVVFAWVTPTPNPATRRVFEREVSLDEWTKLGGQRPDELPVYIELAEYEALGPVVFTDPAPVEAPVSVEADRPHPLRYLMTPIAGSAVG